MESSTDFEILLVSLGTEEVQVLQRLRVGGNPSLDAEFVGRRYDDGRLVGVEEEAWDAFAAPLHHRGEFGVLEIPRRVEDGARLRTLGGVQPMQQERVKDVVGGTLTRTIHE